MKPFLDADFLLTTPTARALYHDYAAAMPIIDYHCHVDPREIFEDRRFHNIVEAWLEADHYKWRLMRWNGVDEDYITGGAGSREKFQIFAETLPRAIWNPMYHWCHLELKKYLGYGGILNGDTAQEVWDLSVRKFAEPGMSVRGLIAQSNVAFIGTTDDPTSTLEWHHKLVADPSFQPVVAPTFRPDNVLNVEKLSWREEIAALGRSAGIEIADLYDLWDALVRRMDAFGAAGCRASDHGLDYVPYRIVDEARLDAILKKGLRGEEVDEEETEMFKTGVLLFCAEQYHKRGWAMQIHYNCVRNPNTVLHRMIGPNAGCDSMGSVNCAGALYSLLDRLVCEGALPRTILYSLNPGENELLDAMVGAFQDSGVPGKLQHGSGWWFNDTRSGMIAQMTSLANLGILGNFIGMLTDSRSFLSYTRHEYFRRILCELMGGWVENGEYPGNLETVGALVQDICHRNAARYFKLD